MNSVIIPAAGSSRRMGNSVNKQLLMLLNKEVIAYTIDIFYNHSLIDDIILVISEKDKKDFQKVINKYKYKNIKIVIGGDSRRASVYNGLLQVSKHTSKVLIHDGARPFFKKEYIEKIMTLLEKHASVVMAVKLKDTIKRVDGNFVTETLERNQLINVQTPQGFIFDVLLKAYQWGIKNDIKVTDDSSLVEKLGHKTAVIFGDYDNIKITTPEDIKFGEVIVKEGLLCE